jgi:hypothetical protein
VCFVQVLRATREHDDGGPEVLFSVVLFEPGSNWITFANIDQRKLRRRRRPEKSVYTRPVKLPPGFDFGEPGPWADKGMASPVGLFNKAKSFGTSVREKDANCCSSPHV